MKHKTNNIFLYIAITLLSISSALAQENCTNGVDDDGDGFIDCYDGDCAGGPSCADFFYGNPIVCKDEPTENPTFTMKLQWGSEDRSADSHATPAVGDLDNDGLPEVVVINRLDERLFILNGEDGTTAFTYDLGYQPENGIVLANLDGGDCANIYVSRDNSSTITALDCEANFLWQTNASDRVGIMGIADFNGDGNAELYYKTEIMDAATGNIIVAGTADNWVQKYAHSAIAVDILDDSFCADCSGLELITGNQIWAINIAAGTRTLAKDLNDLFAAEIPVNNKRYYTKYFNTNQNRTAISVADYNQDGHVDVLMPGAYGSSNSSQTTIFFWDVFNDAYLVYDGGVNHSKGTGRLNVSDIDGDGQMNTTYVSDQILYALDENLNVLWTKGIDEGSSGFTGTTVFDFDGDGAAETIYRSESYLYIIDGTDGSTRTTVACKSRTQEEYPLVADVDNDGSSELCVPCYTSNSTPFSPYSNTRYSQIRIYEADGGEIWQPSRRVWNQHGYYNVNVNDDLTIPAQQQDHTAIFGTVNCDTGVPEDNRALNGFLNQSTFLEADGCPSYVSPDLNMAGNVVATPSLCPLTTFDVSFDIENTGDTDIFGTLPVTFYDGDPETPGAIKLNTETVVINNFLQGETRTINMTVEGPGGDFDLYISINNNGQDPPITPGSGGFPECDFTNNIANISVTYTPFTLTVNKLEENRRCDPSKPNNGEAEAYFQGTLGGDYETFWVEDFAGLSNGDRSDAGVTAWTSTKGTFNPIYWGVNTKSGNKVYRTRKTGLNNEVSEVTWLSEVIDISGHTDVDLSLEMLTNNTLEASGGGRDYMRAFYILDGGAETEFDVNGELYGSFLYAVAEQEDLNGSTLQIKVTFHTTGNGEYQYLDNVQVSGNSVPVVQQYTDADGFEFDWYNAGDFSAPVANGSLYTGMPTGSYDVVGYYPGGNCYSDTVNIVINDSIPTFSVHVYEAAPYTDCADPDGALSSFVYTQTDGSGNPSDTLTAGYTFSWVLSTEGITPVGTGPDLTNIGSDDYTVRVEQIITGCSSSASGAPSSGLTFPADPTVVKTDIIACTGPGTTGAASASVGGITAGYDFEWFYESVDATPDYTGSSITGLLEGTYYVRAIDNGSSCPSSLVTFDIIDTSADPNPSAVEVQADSECGGNNGIATADGDGAGTVAGYTFEWFVGNNTLPGNLLPAAMPGSSISADGATASGLASGTYTVRATASGCESTTTVEITDAEVIPTYNIVTQVPAGNALQVTNKAYVRMPQLLSGTSSFTISYWVEISTQNYLDDHRIFSSGGKNESQVMLWTSDVFGISFVVKAESAGSVGKINTLYKPTGWVQLTGTWDEASGEMKLYANGVKVGETTYFGDNPAILEGVIDNGPDMYLARDGNLGANKFEGRIDEVKIYNRVLDESEILTVLCDPAGGSTTGLQAHYDFNGVLSTANGATVPDVSGNGNDGTLDKPGAAPGSVQYVTSGIQCPLAGMVNNTSCDPANPNGEINLVGAVDPQPENYEYTLYEGTEVDPAELLATNTSGIFSDLPDGFYTVVTRDQDTNCETDPLTLSIATLPEEPSIVTSITDNTGCTVGNGEILVTSSSVSSEPSSYTYELYDGYTYTTLLQTETVADGSTGFNFTGLSTGEYRIHVTNDDILCEGYVDVYVDDASVNPTWNHPSTIENNNTVCVGTPNGFASVAPVGTLSNFTFEWYTGELVDPGQLIAGETQEFIDELAAGKYTVVATSTITGCETPPKTVTIDPEPVLPNVVAVEVKPQNSCDVGDGILRAYVDEPDPSDCVECIEADDYSFQWFLGNDTSTPLIEATDPGNNSNPTYVDSSRVEGLTGDYDYTVQVTNNLTGCTNETTISLTYDPLPPMIDAANSKVTANTLCGPSGNGSVVAAVNFVGETINGAVNDQTWDIITDCNTVTDLNSSILPDGSIELTPDVNNQAGKAYLGDSVDFSKPTRIDYWMYLGNKDNGADGITFIFHQDPAGRDALGRYGCNLGIGDESCFGGTETAIQPSVAVEFDTYNNGAATKDPAWDHAAFVINGEMDKPQGDVGVFYNANQPRIVNGQDDVEAPNTELRVTITIVPNFDGTQTFSVYVEDELRLQRTQDFINDLFSGNPKTIGGFTASTGGARNQQYVRLDPYFGEYDFDWYTGSGVDPSNEIVGADRPFLCDLLGGDYTLVVTYGGTGCTSSPPVTFTIPNNTDTATVSFSGVSNTVCDTTLALGGNFTGSLTANIAQNPADYLFAWFEGTAPSADTISTNQTISNIPGGDYTVVVESIAGGCIAIKDTTLVDVTVDPAIVDVNADVTIQNVTSCEGSATYPNGSITVNTVAIGTGPFGFWYYYGSDTTTGTFLTDASDIFTQTGTPGTASVNVSGNGTSMLTGLSAGDYTIIVVDSASGCTSIEANVQIIDVPTIPNLDQNITPNTVCDPALAASGVYDGEVEIITTDGSDAVTDYTYLWYDGTGTGTPTSWTVSNNILSEAPDGNYTVVATNTTTGCDTTIYAAIGDATVVPTIDNVTAQNITACEGGPAYPNGSITVAAVTGTGPYDYLYYYGTDATTGTLLADGSDIFTQTGAPGVASVNVSGSGTTTITGLSAGDYTIVLVDLASGCTSIEANVQLIDVPTIPELDQNVTPNTICDPSLTAAGVYDGEVEIITTDATNVTDYSYIWYDGTGTGTPTAYTATNNILSEAPDGNYTVVATSNLTGCDTTIYATIGDATTIPTIDNVTTQNVTACEGGPAYPNGSITVAAVTGTGPYDYLYYYGTDATTGTLLADGSDIFTQTGAPGVASVNVSGSGTTTITGLSAGDYTIVLIDSASGCTSIEANVQLINVPTIPELDQNVTPNTICDPGLAASGNYDGEVEIITTDATNVTDYSYVWYDGTGTGTPTAYTASNNILSEAPDGNYTVVATSNLTGCDTTIYATIGDATTIPTIDNVTTQNVTACEGGPAYPNGSITVAAVTGTGPYDYLYYYGTDAATGTLLSDGIDIFTQTGTPGAASVNVNGNGTATITGLSAGDYTIVLIDQASGCSSIEANVALSNVPTIPALDQNITPNTVCDIATNNSGTYDGEVEIITTDATNVTDYTYVWYDGTGTGTPTTYTATNNILSEAPDGNYTVVATSNLTGCDTTIYATIGDATVDPVLGTFNITDMTVCDGAAVYPNGAIEVDEPSITGSGDYSYEFYWGPSVDAAKLLSDGDNITFEKTGFASGVNIDITANVISNLDTGFYTIVAIDNVSGCISGEQTVEIEDVLIAINVPAPAINHYTNCDAPDGSITVSPTMASGPEPALGYSYQWYYGSGTGNTLDAADLTDGTALAGTTTATVSGLEDGTYTVLITNNDTGCDTEEEYDIQDQRVYPVVDPGLIVTTPNVNCAGAPTGTIDPTAAVSEPGPYVFTLYDAADVVITTEDTGGGDDGIFDGLAAANYKIGVELASGCVSVATASVTVSDNFTYPNLSVTKLSNETSCIAPNGQIRVNDPGTAPAAGFDIIVYSGIGTGGAVQETIGDDYTGAFPISGTANMATGTYTVQMLNNDTGCESLVQVTINNVPDRPTLVSGNVTKTDDTNCTSENGTITISTVTNPGVNPIFNLYSGSSIVPANLITTAQHPATNHTFSGLAPGTYTVSVIKDESGCESNGITRTINFVPVSFTPAITTYSDQSSCLMSDPNGELIATIAAAGTGPSTNVADYNFEWYQGQNTNPANRITTGGIIPTATVFSTNGSRVSGLPSGTYRLKVIEPVSGCFYVIDETIDLITQTPTIPGGGVIITDADQCAPSNGEINITVTDGGSPQPYDGAGGYTFELYVGTIGAGETPIQTINETSVSGAPNYQATVTFTDLQPDDYTIRAIDNNTSCLVTSSLQTVGFVGATLAFDENNMANIPLTGCFGNDGTLDIGTSLTIPGNTDDVDITWYVGSDTSNTANLISNVVTGPPPAAFSDITNYNGLGYDIINGNVTNLPAVSYTGVAELSNGCKFLLEVDLSIIDAPDLLTAVTTPVSRCSPTYDGEVTLTVTPNNGNNAGQYNYYLYPGTYTVTDVTMGSPWDPPANSYNGGVTSGNDGDGNGTGTFTNNGADTPDAITISELDSGTYTVIIEINTGSGCVTNVETVTIAPPTEPNVTLDTKTDNTVCDVSGALDYNGSITVDAEHPDFAGSTFTFDWYYDSDGDGDFTAGQTAVANGANGAGAGSFVTGATTTNSLSATVSGVGPGWYRVIATHTDANNAGVNATTCPDTLDVQIVDDFVELAIQPAAITTQTNVLDCSGGADEFGEFLLATVREDGADLDASTVGGNFTITWEYDNGGGFAAYAPNVDQNHSNDLAAGDYRITAVSTITGCDVSYDFTIDDVTEDPVINMLNLADNTICVGGPIGTIEADGQIIIEIQDELGAVQDPVDYDVEWFLNSIAGGNEIPASQVTGADITTTAVDVTIDDLPGGTYWLRVTKNNGDDEQCETTASFVLIDDPAEVTIQKVLATDYTTQHNTDCTPGENGRVTLINVYEDGVADPISNGNYLFNWYDADQVTPISVGAVGGAFNEDVTNLPAGTYYVEAENQTTDCVSDKVPFTINDERVIPNLQLAQTLPDTTCVGSLAPSGEVTASVILPGGGSGNPADYTFTWYEGVGTGTPITVGAVDGAAVNGEMYEQLPAGIYTVEVVDNVTPGNNCTITAQITVSRFSPVISIQTSDITIQNDLECNIDNGSATVNAVTVTKYGGGTYKVNSGDAAFADFDFNWYFTASGGLSQDNDNIFDLRPAGTYYVSVSNTQTMCAMPAGGRKAVTIQNTATVPNVQLVTKTPDEYCTTVANEGDGTLEIEIIHEGNNPANPTDYTITWYRGTGTATTLASVPGSSVIAGSGTQLSGLSTGTYTVVVAKSGTPNDGCSTQKTFTIVRDIPTYSLPESAMTIQDNQNCLNPNGTITINGIHIDGVFEDFSTTGDTYTIVWTGLPGTAVVNTVNFANDEVTALEAGLYEVDITNDRTNCTVNATIELDDIGTNPVIQLVTKNPDEYCATVTPNEGDGDLTIKVVHEGNNPANPLDYVITWYRGTGTATTLASAMGSATVNADRTVLTGLSTGTYTVTVSKSGTPNDGCFTQQTFTINRDAPVYSLPESAMTIQDNQNCVNPNGTITINGIHIDGVFEDFSTTGDTYTIAWTGLPGTAVVNTVNFANDEVTALEAGLYEVDITNDRTGCTVNATIELDDIGTTPVVQLVSKNPDEYCATLVPNEGDGDLTIKVVHEGNTPADPLDYAVTWYRGTGTATTLASALGTASVSAAGTTLTGLSTGTYTVTVSKNGTPNDGCLVQQTFTINRDPQTYSLPEAAITKTNNFNCSTPNGTITIDGVFIDGVFDDFSATADTYTLNWTGLPGGAVLNTVNFADDQVTTIPGGTYTVDVTNERTNCTVTASITITDVTSNPLVQLVTKTPDEYCATVTPNEGDGTLNIKLVHEGNNPADSTLYNFEWFRGTGTGTALAGGALGSATISPNGTVLTGLSAGTYTVRVTDANTPNLGCVTTQTFTINRDAPTYSLPLSAMTIQDNLNCSNPNGSITIDGVRIDGVFEDFSTTGDTYTINWTGLPGTATLNTVNFANDQVNGIEGGTYTVDVLNDRTGCTVSADVVLDDVTSNPLVQLVIKQPDEYCDNTGFQGNGSLELRIVHEGNNPANPTDYNITWYRGNGTGTTLASAPGSSVLAGSGTQLSGLSSGIYTVVVTKNGTPNDQCLTTTTFSIEKDIPLFSIQTSSVVIAHNTNCTNPNGSIQLSNVVVDGVVRDLATFGADYAFTWPDGYNGGTPGSINSPNDIATGLPAGTYKIIGENVATGCATDTINVIILDDPTEPALSFTVDAINTNCGPTKNGQLTVTATTADGNPNTGVGRYTFTWYDGQGTATGTSYVQSDGVGANDNQSTLLALDSGYYTVTVFDNINECSITGTYAVSETKDVPKVLLSDIVVRADTTCNVGSSGTIIVADSSFATGVLDDFDVEIRSGTSTGPIVAQSTAGSGNTDLTVSSLDPGTFYVTATRAATECPAAPVKIIILDERFPPTIQLDTMIANPNCGGTIALGSIAVTANGFDETNPDYIFQWYVGTIGGGVIVPGANGGNTATMINVAEGQYELSVTNVNTGCVATQLFDLPATPVNPRISSYEVSNNLICNVPGDGSFEVNQIRWNGNFFDAGVTADSLNMVTNYTFEYYSDAALTTPVADLDLSTPLQLDGLSAGTYYARVRRNDSQCASGPIQFTIQDIPQYPVIQLTQLVADSTCNGMNPNGTISALVDGVANDTLYTYDWFEVDPVSGARISGSLSNNDTIMGLAAGRYEVEVTGVSTGCVSTAQRTVINAPIDVRILSMSGIDPTSCDPPNGIIEVVSITPGVLSDYTFTFYLRDPGNGGVQVQTALGPAFASASSGTYYVEAMHNVYGCTNNLNEIVLGDNLTYPDIDLISFNNQTNCDPGNPNGEISAMADGSTDNTAYTFEWRDASNTVVEPNNATVSNIPAGTFTLNVTDNSTGCMSSAMFDIIDDYPDPIRLVISTSSNTNCTNPNGEVSATIRNLQALGKPITDYLFYWFNGDQTAGVPDIANPDYTGTLITDLPDGDYTVYVVDASDAFCTSEPTLVTIQDRTLPPPFQVEIQNHVTICYDSLPNGRAKINPASLEASRELFEFRYEWYVGTAADTAGQVPFVTGIRADSLDVGSYSVLSTDLRTGCQNLVTFDIIDDTDAVPAPDVNVVSDRDNCMFANGHAVASISGTIAGYRFEWFLASGDTTTVQFTGHEVFTLDSVDYKVRATRLSTGCISPRTPVEIINAIEDPVFEIATTTSLCLRTEDGAFNQFTGTAEVIFSQFGVIKQIDWIAPDGTVFSNDIKLVNAQPGTWEVRFVLDNDCEYFGSFGIQTALKIYNGVSANADGLNDYFFIDCIDYFPNNNVQIFNRDGTKVWESDSYNNNDIRFDGFSNVGRGGLQLPAGTYFYIIEKGPQQLGTDDDLEDNTIRPRIQGYLELVR